MFIHELLLTVFGILPGRDFVWKIRESITSEAYFQVLIASLRVKYDGILKAGTRHTAFSSLTTSQKPNLLEGTFLEVRFC